MASSGVQMELKWSSNGAQWSMLLVSPCFLMAPPHYSVGFPLPPSLFSGSVLVFLWIPPHTSTGYPLAFSMHPLHSSIGFSFVFYWVPLAFLGVGMLSRRGDVVWALGAYLADACVIFGML